MALFDWLEVVQFTTGGWRCALTMPGEQCVMAFGVVMMLQWSADNLDMQPLDVSLYVNLC